MLVNLALAALNLIGTQPLSTAFHLSSITGSYRDVGLVLLVILASTLMHIPELKPRLYELMWLLHCQMQLLRFNRLVLIVVGLVCVCRLIKYRYWPMLGYAAFGLGLMAITRLIAPTSLLTFLLHGISHFIAYDILDYVLFLNFAANYPNCCG